MERHSVVRWVPILSVILALAACKSDKTPVDADAGGDAGSPDAGSPDAGAADGGRHDAGPDAGSGGDAGSDAGVDGGADAGPALRSAEDKIRAAEASGAIDHNHSIAYRLLAATEDDRLPAQYAADAVFPVVGFRELLIEAAEAKPSMPADLQTLVAPFFKRPSDPSSIWATGGAHPAKQAEPVDTYVDCSSTPVRIHYEHPNDAARAQTIASEIDASGMYSIEKRLLAGHVPCDDSVNLAASPPRDNGGDSKSDMYIIDFTRTFHHRAEDFAVQAAANPNTAALVAPDSLEFGCSPGYALLKGSYSAVDPVTHQTTTVTVPFDAEYKQALSHELFHLFQLGFPNHKGRDPEWLWVDEATAEWASTQVYPTLDQEHGFLYLPGTLWNSTVPSASMCSALGHRTGPLDCITSGSFDSYSTYLFFTSILETQGASAASVLPALYANQHERSMQALKDAIGGSFDDKFKRFALENLNTGDDDLYRDHGQRLDKLIQQLDFEDRPRFDVRVGQDAQEEIKLNETEAGYYHLQVTDTGAAFVKQLKLDLSEFKAAPTVHLQALLTIGLPGQPGYLKRTEDWTGKDERHFCREQDQDYVTDITLVVDNSAIFFGEPAGGTLRGMALDSCETSDGILRVSSQASGNILDSDNVQIGGTEGSMTAVSRWKLTFTGRDPDTNEKIYSFNAFTEIFGSASAHTSSSTSFVGFEEDAAYDANTSVSGLGANPPVAGDDAQFYPDEGQAFLPGELRVATNGDYGIYFTPAFVRIQETRSSHDYTVEHDKYHPGDPRPAGCGSDDIVINTETFSSQSNVLEQITRVCGNVTSDVSSDPHVEPPGASIPYFYIGMFQGKVGADGQIHAMLSTPITTCNFGDLFVYSGGGCIGSGTASASLVVKFPQ